MKDDDPIYFQFWTALDYEAKKNWHRQNSTLAAEGGIKPSSLTEILRGNTKAKYDTRVALAKACGFLYEDFIEYGKMLLKGKPADKATSPPEKKSNIESASESKGSVQMEDASKDLIRILKGQINDLKDQIEDQKEQIKDLKLEKEEYKQERLEFREELKSQREEIRQLYAQNAKLAKALGEANQALNKFKAQQANGLDAPNQAAANG